MSRNLQCIRFVVDEIKRFQAMDRAQIKGSLARDLLAYIPHPEGLGHITIGVAADEKLLELTSWQVSKSQWAGKVDPHNVRRHLKKVIAERFVVEGRRVNQSESDRAVHIAIKIASKDTVELTHYLPCHIGSSIVEKGIRFGPVTFLPMQKILPKIKARIAERSDRTIDASGEKGDRKQRFQIYLEQINNYYLNFEWVAEVIVPDADREVSERVAFSLTQHAMSCLHVLLGERRSDRMQVGGPGVSQRFDSIARFTSDGEPWISISSGSNSNTLFDGWWGYFEEGDWPFIVDSMGKAVEAIAEGDPVPHLVERFLDAANWYREGIKEDSAGPKIVKYVSSLERLLITGKEDEIANVLAVRGAAVMCLRSDRLDAVDQIKEDIKRVYNVRSNLVHGKWSPANPKVDEWIVVAEALTREILIACLVFYSSGHFLSAKNRAADLESGFSKLIDRLAVRQGVPIGNQPRN